jgi:phosphoglycolate phosphatase
MGARLLMFADTMSGLSRHWDGYDAYLFDIDGTLLNCTDAIHYFAFCDTLSEIAGRPMNLDGVVAHGNTDVGILRDALQQAGVPDEQWRPRLDTIRSRLGEFVEREKGGLCATALPGVVDVLKHLRGRGAVLGVATGNLEAIGRIKLQHCDLLGYFQFAGFSDDYEYRKDVFSGALRKARKLIGEAGSVCVVGDTPADIQAAKANDLEVIAVATGIYSMEQLRAEEPGLCVPSLDILLRDRQALAISLQS